MFSVEISDPRGVEGEFNVATPVVALDLALRAQWYGLAWRVWETGPGQVLSLRDLRDRAASHAAGRPGDSLLLHDVDARHGVAVRSSLN